MEEELKTEIREFMADVAKLAKKAQQPYDPKIEALLEVVYSLAKEQIELGKQYAWRPRAEQDDKFLDDTDEDTPSADDLRRMVGG